MALMCESAMKQPIPAEVSKASTADMSTRSLVLNNSTMRPLASEHCT
ncbi:MAG: hypothetical protein JWO64_1534 [Hyphomicrobiales bacterium]|nr:hypothetical protein [Hyphomicrobiales bacterium]